MIEGIESVEPIGEFSDIFLGHQYCAIIPIFIGEDLPAVSPKCFDNFGQILIDSIEVDALLLAERECFFQRFADAVRPKNDFGASFLFGLNLGDVFSIGAPISGHLFSTKVPSKSTAIIFALFIISPFHVMQLSASAQ